MNADGGAQAILLCHRPRARDVQSSSKVISQRSYQSEVICCADLNDPRSRPFAENASSTRGRETEEAQG